MSYSIHYGPEGAVYKVRRKSYFGYVGVVFVLAVCLLAVGWALPEQTEQLRQILFPWTRESVEIAFSDFCADVRQGEPFRDAAAAFCLEILNESDALQ